MRTCYYLELATGKGWNRLKTGTASDLCPPVSSRDCLESDLGTHTMVVFICTSYSALFYCTIVLVYALKVEELELTKQYLMHHGCVRWPTA